MSAWQGWHSSTGVGERQSFCGTGQRPLRPLRDDSFVPVASWSFDAAGMRDAAGETPPGPWVAAINRVRSDLSRMQVGDGAYGWDVESSLWTLEVGVDGVSVTVSDGAGVVRAEPVRLGALEWLSAAACVWLASMLQSALSSNAGVRWPVDGAIALSPHAIDGDAAWMVSGTSIIVTPIGTLQHGVHYLRDAGSGNQRGMAER